MPSPMAGWAPAPRLLARLLAVCAAALSYAAAAPGASAATLPPEGIFENCNLDSQMSTCVQRLQLMHQGGLQVVVISAASGSPSSLESYAATAQSLGMSVMWELSDPRWWAEPATSTSTSGTYGGFAALCGCQQNGQILGYLIHWLGQLPATYGYYA